MLRPQSLQRWPICVAWASAINSNKSGKMMAKQRPSNRGQLRDLRVPDKYAAASKSVLGCGTKGISLWRTGKKSRRNHFKRALRGRLADAHVDDGCAARKSANFCLHCFHRSLLLRPPEFHPPFSPSCFGPKLTRFPSAGSCLFFALHATRQQQQQYLGQNPPQL